MNAPHVRAEGATRTFRIAGIGEIGAAAGVLRDCLIGMIGGQFDGGSIAPSTDKLGGQFFFSAGVKRRLFVEEGAEGREILMKLAVDHEGAVAGEKMGHGSYGQFARLVGVAEQQLSCGEGRPGAIVEQLALPWLGAALDAEIFGVAKAVGKSEMLAGALLAVNESRSGVLGVENGGAMGVFDEGEEMGAAGVERLGSDAVDADPGVNAIVPPDFIPVLRRIDAAVSEDACALLSCLAEIRRERWRGLQRAIPTA